VVVKPESGDYPTMCEPEYWGTCSGFDTGRQTAAILTLKCPVVQLQRSTGRSRRGPEAWSMTASVIECTASLQDLNDFTINSA
jgi:hypothetical protein